jgi:hypothetical protein
MTRDAHRCDSPVGAGLRSADAAPEPHCCRTPLSDRADGRSPGIVYCGILEMLMTFMHLVTRASRALAPILAFSLSLQPMARAAAASPPADDLGWPSQKLSASNGAAQYGFGRAIAVSGDTAFIAALNAPAGGAVYVFERTDTGWVEVQQLNATDSPDGADFGSSIAIEGDTALIGADRTTLTDDGQRHQGAAYIFRKGTDGLWTQTQMLTASDFGAEAQFGNAVAVSGDTALIGAYNSTIDENSYQGAAYVFTRSGTTWTETQKLVADDGIGGDDFGNAVALDGNRALVAAEYGSGIAAQSGTVYAFENASGVWNQTVKIIADDGVFFDTFGYAIALAGDTALITAPYAQVGDNFGQGAVYVFDLAAGGESQVQKLVANDGAASDALGASISLDGDTVLVGASSALEYAGEAYLFANAGGTWSELGQLSGSDEVSGDNVGYAVALSGTTAIVGAPLQTIDGNTGQGAAYFFERLLAEEIFADGFDARSR